MASLRWTSEALGRLEDIELYVAQDNPAAAKKQIAKLLDRATQLVVAPRSGRTVPDYQDEQVREILDAPYRIIYYLNGDCVEILSVMHYRQLLPRKRDLMRWREHFDEE
jgi:plasmid stabilization system protein ParE